MDYFFAACEELRHPELKSKVFVVGTAPIDKKEKGVVQTCNYEARKFGIHSAMPTMQAIKLKPDLIYIESDDNYYSETSDRIMNLLKEYGFNTEIISVDEAALDLGEMDYSKAEAFAKEIKNRINKEIGLPCTIGISTGKIYAKMACESVKPNGLGLIKEDELITFLKDKDIDKLVGVGAKTAAKLRTIGVKTIGDLSKADPNVLVEQFGTFGKELFLLSNGKDKSKISSNYEILSIGRERTLDNNTKELLDVEKMIEKLSKEVIEELKRQNLWFRGISVKAKYYDFTDHIKNKKLNNYTDSFDVLYTTSINLIKGLVNEKSIRKVGVRVYSLEKKKGQKSIL